MLLCVVFNTVAWANLGPKETLSQWNDTGNISREPRVRTEADAAYEKMLDPIAGSPATGKSVGGIIDLFVDDLFGTGGTEMEQRVLGGLRKDFQVGSEWRLQWCDLHRTKNSLDKGSSIRIVHSSKTTKGHWWIGGDPSGTKRSTIKQDRTPSSFTTRSQLIVSRRLPRWKTGVIIYEKVYASPRPSPMISFKDNWMNELDSEVAGSSKDTQRIQPKPKTQLSSTVRPVCGQESTKEIEKRTVFDHEDVIDSTSTVRPVCGLESTKRCVLTPTKVEDQTRMGRSVGGSKGGTQQWFQSTRTVTCSCETSRTSPSSRACEKDRKSSSSTSTSIRLVAEKHLQPIQQKVEGDDPRIGQCGVIRVVRNCTKSTMFSLSCLLESMNCVLHLRTMFGWQRTQKKV